MRPAAADLPPTESNRRASVRPPAHGELRAALAWSIAVLSAGVEPRAAVRVMVDTSDRIAAVVAAAVPTHARARGVLLATHRRGPTVPWCPGRAASSAVSHALSTATTSLELLALGRAASEPHKFACPQQPPRGIRLSLGADAQAEVPRVWIGRHALLLLPTFVDPRGHPTGAEGPVAAALAGLAAAAHVQGGRDHADLGAQLLAEIFAGFTWVVDAEWVLMRARRQGTRPHAARMDRVFVHGGLGVDARGVLAEARTLDAWLRSRGANLSTMPPLCVEGRLAAMPWPRACFEPVGFDGPLWPSPRRAQEVLRS